MAVTMTTCVCTHYVQDHGISDYVAAIRRDDGAAICVMHLSQHKDFGTCQIQDGRPRKGNALFGCPQCLHPQWFIPTIHEDDDFPWG